MPKDLSYLYPVFPILASIAAFLSLLPIPLHWGAGNITMVALSFWCIIGCIICAIDTCIWHGNLRNPHPIWGDIVQVYYVMICPAVASCTMYIQYRLWTIARIKSVFITKQQVRFRLIKLKLTNGFIEATSKTISIFLLVWDSFYYWGSS